MSHTSISDRPATAVLVHGALSDASIWAGVTSRLQERGIPVACPAMPMRNLDGDVSYLSAFIDGLEGPLVLVGHSYGGTVIAHPWFARDRVRSLVFVSAFQPGAGESTGELNGRYPGSRLGEATTIMRPYPGGTDLYLRAENFAEVYAGDLDAARVAVMAAAQRPIEVRLLGESFVGNPSWRSRPSWALVSTEDHSLPPEAMRFMAGRAGSCTVEVATSHASPATRPDEVAALVVTAIEAA